MVEILVEVGDGDARLRAAVRSESMQRAVDVAGSYYLGAGVRVVYSIDPEGFFVRDSAAPAGLVGFRMPEKAAG